MGLPSDGEWKMTNATSAFMLVVALVSASVASARDYVIVELVGASDGYYAAAKRLVELRDGEIVSADVKDLSPLLKTLQQQRPRYVAVVVRPEQFDINLARSFLKLATQVDEDPFVDFSYGFITGDTPEVATALAERASQIEKLRRQPTIGL